MFNGGLLVPFYVGPASSISAIEGGIVQIDPLTGEYIVEPVGLPDIEPLGFVGRNKTYAVSFIATDDDRSAAVLSSGTVSAALTDPMDGNIGLIELGETVNPPSAPMLLGNRAFVSAGGTVHAFPLDQCLPSPLITGFCRPEWSVTLHSGEGNWLRMPSAVGADAIAVPDDDGEVTVLDAATGATRFVGLGGAWGISGLAVAHGFVYTTAGDSELRVYDADGCGLAVCEPVWRADAGGSIGSAPIVAGDVVYVGHSGTVKAYPALGCGTATCTDLASVVFPGGGLTVHPIVWNGRLYATTSADTVGAAGLAP
ncbi:MAG: hypothetical protein ACT4OX_12550 [Actinomycetota bacterium]